METEHKKQLKDEVRVKILGEDENKVMLERIGYVGKKEVGLQGFTCPKSGRNEKFDFCYKKCLNHCKPLPVLRALQVQGEERDEPNTYHVTEILNPPQLVYLRRNNPYYLRPDSLVDMNIGTSWHAKLEETKGYIKELGLEDDYLMEKNFREEFSISLKGGTQYGERILLSGTFDLGVKSTKTLWDYKVMKYFYTFKYLSEGKWDDSTIPMQMNTYRVYGFPEAECMKILCYLKDYKLNMTEKYDINQTETLQVPMIPDDTVEKRVVDLLTEHVMAQKTGKPRPCTDEERWFNRDEIPLRCLYYCAPSEVCSQYAEWRDGRVLL